MANNSPETPKERSLTRRSADTIAPVPERASIERTASKGVTKSAAQTGRLPVEYFRAVKDDWVARMSGPASIILAFLAAYFEFIVKHGLAVLWVAAAACLILTSYRIWSNERRALIAERAKNAKLLEEVGKSWLRLEIDTDLDRFDGLLPFNSYVSVIDDYLFTGTSISMYRVTATVKARVANPDLSDNRIRDVAVWLVKRTEQGGESLTPHTTKSVRRADGGVVRGWDSLNDQLVKGNDSTPYYDLTYSFQVSEADAHSKGDYFVRIQMEANRQPPHTLDLGFDWMQALKGNVPVTVIREGYDSD